MFFTLGNHRTHSLYSHGLMNWSWACLTPLFVKLKYYNIVVKSTKIRIIKYAKCVADMINNDNSV